MGACFVEGCAFAAVDCPLCWYKFFIIAALEAGDLEEAALFALLDPDAEAAAATLTAADTAFFFFFVGGAVENAEALAEAPMA